MTIQDLQKNRERIIKKIKFQINLATLENISHVMNKMIAMLPSFENEKPTLGNIDKLTVKATLSYIKFGMISNSLQREAFEIRREIKLNTELPSSLQF